MILPDQIALEDAAVQLAHASQKLAPLLEMLDLRCDAPPLDPAHRGRWEQNTALLRALKAYFPAVANLLSLHEEQSAAMGQEMANAQARYALLAVERDYLKAEMQQANTRYYQALDAFNTLHPRLSHVA